MDRSDRQGTGRYVRELSYQVTWVSFCCPCPLLLILRCRVCPPLSNCPGGAEASGSPAGVSGPLERAVLDWMVRARTFLVRDMDVLSFVTQPTDPSVIEYA